MKKHTTNYIDTFIEVPDLIHCFKNTKTSRQSLKKSALK